MSVIAPTAKSRSICSIRTRHITAPSKLRYHLDRKLGRYDGRAAKCSRKEIAHSAPYVTMKNMDTTRATRLTLPSMTKTIAIAEVTSVALRGSFVAPTPAETKSLRRGRGTMRSAPRACSVRGATRMDPIAEEIVAHARPIGMIGPQIAIRLIMR